MIAAVFLAGASYNALVTLRAPATELQRLIALSPWPPYQQVASRVAMLHPAAFVVLITLFEVAIAVSTLLALPVRRAGYGAALLFFVVLIPLIGWYGLTNLIWAVPAFALFRRDHSPALTRAV